MIISLIFPYFRGHGTYEDEFGRLLSSTCGITENLNKLLYTKALGGRYVGEVGDVIVGRVVEVRLNVTYFELFFIILY